MVQENYIRARKQRFIMIYLEPRAFIFFLGGTVCNMCTNERHVINRDVCDYSGVQTTH